MSIRAALLFASKRSGKRKKESEKSTKHNLDGAGVLPRRELKTSTGADRKTLNRRYTTATENMDPTFGQQAERERFSCSDVNCG